MAEKRCSHVEVARPMEIGSTGVVISPRSKHALGRKNMLMLFCSILFMSLLLTSSYRQVFPKNTFRDEVGKPYVVRRNRFEQSNQDETGRVEVHDREKADEKQGIAKKHDAYPIKSKAHEEETTSGDDATEITSKGNASQADLAVVDTTGLDFTSLETVFQSLTRNKMFKPLPLLSVNLEAAGIGRFLLYYKIQSASLPVFNKMLEDSSEIPLQKEEGSLGEEMLRSEENDSEQKLAPGQENIVRWLDRHEPVMGVAIKGPKHAQWLQIGKDEWIPMTSRGASNGLIVHVKLISKIPSLAELNSKPFEKRSRQCALVQEPSAKTNCFRFAYAIKETRRILKEFNLLQVIKSKPNSDIELPDEHEMSFDDKMRLLFRSMTEKETCRNSEWTQCSFHDFCTWTYDSDRNAMKCKHIDLQPLHPNLGKFVGHFDTYNKSYDFVDDAQDKKRYFVYQPSGGINNQRIQMEHALTICILCNRTCVIPHAAQHTNYYFRYNLHQAEHMISMQRIFDWNEIRQVVDVVTIPEHLSLVDWIKSVGGGPYIAEPTGLKSDPAETNGWRVVMRDSRKMAARHVWKDKDIVRFQDDPSRFLFFANHTMWGTIELFMYSPSFKAVRNSVKFVHPLKELAINLANKLGNYNSLHVRRGDKKREANFAEVVRDAAVYGQRMLPYIDLVPGLYVATDERDSSYFDPVREMGFKVMTWVDLDEKELMDYITRFPLQMFRDVLGMVEQMICTYSFMFLGSSYSTFTMYILRMRRFYPILAVYNTTSTDGHVVVHQPTVRSYLDFSHYTSTCNPFQPDTHKAPC